MRKLFLIVINPNYDSKAISAKNKIKNDHFYGLISVVFEGSNCIRNCVSVWTHATGKVRPKTLNILVSPLLQMFHDSVFVGIEEIITALLA